MFARNNLYNPSFRTFVERKFLSEKRTLLLIIKYQLFNRTWIEGKIYAHARKMYHAMQL